MSNPLELTGPAFLGFYAVNLAIAGPVERAVYEAASGREFEVAEVQTRAKNAFQEVHEKMERLGLLLSSSRARTVRWVPALVLLAVLLLGVVKIGVGMARHRPVGF